MIEIIQYEGDAQPRRKKASDKITDSIILWKWVEVVKEEQPEYDTATQKLISKEEVVGDSLVTSWTIVDKTQEEQELYMTEQARQETLNKGFDTGRGYSLGIDTEDQNAFTRLLTLLREANASDTQDVIIKDKDGVKQTITYGELRSLMIDYGLYCQQLFNEQ